MTSSEKVTVQDCSLKSFGEELSETIETTDGAARSMTIGAVWARPVSITITRDPESKVGASLRPSALIARPHGDCEDRAMFGLTARTGVAGERSTARTV